MVTENVADENKLEVLRRDFNFTFRIPGGSSRNGQHASLGIIYRFKKGEIQILVIPYNPTIRVDRRYEEIFDEMPEGTLELKILEQAGVRLGKYSLIGFQEAKNNNPEVKSEKHSKYVYSTDDYDDSNIRTVASPDKRLDPPRWVEIELLRRYLFPGHLWALDCFENKVLGPRLKEVNPHYQV